MRGMLVEKEMTGGVGERERSLNTKLKQQMRDLVYNHQIGKDEKVS